MRAAIWLGEGSVEVREVDDPDPAPGEQVVRVIAAGICGSDLHAYRGRAGGRVPPLILGHEATVEDETGNRSAVFPLLDCGHCDACRRGDTNLCGTRGLLGLSRPGLLADLVSLPSSCLVPLPASIDAVAGAMIEPMATAMQVGRITGPGTGSRVLVIGAGAVGLLAVHALRSTGAAVDVVDPVGSRTSVAVRLGADRTGGTPAELPDATGAYDVVLDAVGAASTWADAILAVRNGGTIAMVGLAARTGELDMGQVVRRGVHVIGIYGYRRSDFAAALDLVARSPLQLDWMSVRPLTAAAEMFAALETDPAGVIKVVFAPAPLT